MTNENQGVGLEPCPFCGGAPILKKFEATKGFYVYCPHDGDNDESELECAFQPECKIVYDTKEKAIKIWNTRNPQPDTQTVDGNTSDGYHTFNELYEHRHALFAALCAVTDSWKSLLHSDGTMFSGWFVAGINTKEGQITYHLPIRLWGSFDIPELDQAPEWDGHTSDDVVSRLHALRPYLKQKDGEGWLPIESAPRDGSSILIWDNYSKDKKTDGYGIAVGRWDKTLNGWLMHQRNGNIIRFTNPAYWQTLPLPPAHHTNKEG